MSPVPAYATPAEALAAGDLDALFAIRRAQFGGWTMEATDTGGDQSTEDSADQTEDTTSEDAGEDTDKRVQRANREAQRYRQELREAQTQLAAVQAAQQESATVLQALRAALTGEQGSTEPDPAALAAEAENLRNQLAQQNAHLLVHELATDPSVAANPVALLDSRRFTDALAKIPADAPDYRDQVAQAIKDAVEANANLRANPGQAPARGGAPGAGTGSQQPAGAVTQEQFNAMGYAQRTELFSKNPDLYRRLAGN